LRSRLTPDLGRGEAHRFHREPRRSLPPPRIRRRRGSSLEGVEGARATFSRSLIASSTRNLALSRPFVAATNNYFDNVGTARRLGEALLAVLLWPLVLIGVDIDLR
jgi:hypothetical protein